MRVKEESEKVDLKLNTKKTKMKASCPMSSWQIEGGKVEVWQISSAWALKSLQMVTAALKSEGACSLEEKLSLM